VTVYEGRLRVSEEKFQDKKNYNLSQEWKFGGRSSRGFSKFGLDAI